MSFPTAVSRAVTSLAILKVNWDIRRKDYIDNFVPFALDIIGTYEAGTQVVIPEVQTAMQNQCGIRVPQAALNLILSRIAKEGLLRKEYGLYIRQPGSYESKQLKNIESSKLLVSSIISELISYCKDTFQITWTTSEAEEALLNFLEVHDTDILISSSEGSIFPAIGKSPKNSRFLVSSYVHESMQKGGPSAEALETVVKGHMLACAIVFPNPNSIMRKFERTNFYLDTKFLLRLIGLQDIGMQPACQELVDMIYQKQGNLRVFSHTVNEIHEILEAIANRSALTDTDEGYGEVWDYLISHGYTPSTALLINAKLSKTLSDKNIQSDSVPGGYDKFGVDEVKLQKLLDEELSLLRPEGRRKDLESITAIYRLREGKYYHEFEKCPAFFVTTSKGVILAASKFFNTNMSDKIPLCLTDAFLTNLLWLKGPDQAKDLPRQRLMCSCITWLNPNESLWYKYIADIKKLRQDSTITDDDYYLLRYSLHAREELMEHTLGDDAEFKSSSIPDILNAVKEHIREEERTKAQVLVSEAENKAAVLSSSLEIVSAELQKKQRHDIVRLLKKASISRGIARGISISLRILLALPMVCGIVTSILGLVSIIRINTALIVIIAVASIIGDGLYAYDWLKGTIVSNIARRVEVKTHRVILRFLKHIFG